MISLAHLYPQCWFLALFALVPFFWRVIRTSLRGAIVAGTMLAVCYTLAVYPIRLYTDPGSVGLTLLALCAAFVAFAVTVNRLRTYLGFNAVLAAVLWLPMEYFLTHYAGLGNFFTVVATESAPLLRIGSLFGLLMVAFLVVLVNSLILIILTQVARESSSRTPYARSGSKRQYHSVVALAIEGWCGYYRMPRAPPAWI